MTDLDRQLFNIEVSVMELLRKGKLKEEKSRKVKKLTKISIINGEEETAKRHAEKFIVLSKMAADCYKASKRIHDILNKVNDRKRKNELSKDLEIWLRIMDDAVRTSDEALVDKVSKRMERWLGVKEEEEEMRMERQGEGKGDERTEDEDEIEEEEEIIEGGEMIDNEGQGGEATNILPIQVEEVLRELKNEIMAESICSYQQDLQKQVSSRYSNRM